MLTKNVNFVKISYFGPFIKSAVSSTLLLIMRIWMPLGSWYRWQIMLISIPLKLTNFPENNLLRYGAPWCEVIYNLKFQALLSTCLELDNGDELKISSTIEDLELKTFISNCKKKLKIFVFWTWPVLTIRPLPNFCSEYA